MKGKRPGPKLVQAITAAVIARGGKLEGDEYRVRCVRPEKHRNDDANPSMRWHPERAVCRCDVCDFGGGAVDVARALGVELGDRRRFVAPASIEVFARERCLSVEVLRRFGVRLTDCREKDGSRRPALRYPTTLRVDRLKFLDGGRPKYRWARRGGRLHWYGLEQASRPLRAGARTIYVVNGEPSVWACASRGVPAVALAGGEAARPSAPLLEELRTVLGDLGDVAIRVVYDADATGRDGARAVVAALRAGGFGDVEALDLAGELPDVCGADVDDLQRRAVGRLAEVLAGLPVLAEAAPATETNAAPMRPLADLLRAVEELVTRYVIVPSAAGVALALWVAHAHALEPFEATPYLSVTSPEKRCGKTRLLEVLEGIVPRPWRAAGVSAPVLFRRIARDQPTLLLDEVDAVFRKPSETIEALRSLLNAGNRRGSVVSRCDAKGERLVDFKIFCPKVLAGIGALPDTIADRAIPVRLARRKKSETVARFRQRRFGGEATPLREVLAAWAAGAVAQLQGVEPAVPEQLHDRAADAWEPLFAIADLAGAEWPQRARAAALILHGGDGDDGLSITLLRAIADVFANRGLRILTRDLLSVLVEREGEPWGAWWGCDLEKGNVKGPAYKLARLLKPFGIVSKAMRVPDGGRGQGFEHSDFEDVFTRYLNDPTTGQPAPAAAFRADGGSDAHDGVRSSEDPGTVAAQGLSGCQVAQPGDGSGVAPGPVNGGLPPTDPCRVCGRIAWWRQPSGVYVCGACHPPPLAATQGGVGHGR